MATDDEPTIDVETWARIAARLLRRSASEAERELDAVGIDHLVWRKWDAHYKREIEREIAGDELHVSLLYAARCSEEMERRKAAASDAGATQDVSEATGPVLPFATLDLAERLQPAGDTQPFAEAGDTQDVGVILAEPVLPFASADDTASSGRDSDE